MSSGPLPSLTSEEFSTAAVFHTKVKVVFGLERMIQSNNKRMIASGKNLLLGQGPLDFVSLNHLVFTKDLESLA